MRPYCQAGRARAFLPAIRSEIASWIVLKQSALLAGALLCAVAQNAFAADTVLAATLAERSVVVLVTIIVVIGCVLVHYEALNLLTNRLRHIQLAPRRRILLLIFALLLTHVAEIWIFGAGYFLLTADGGHGALIAGQPLGFLDAVYFSAVSYTTLGFGDIVPSARFAFWWGRSR